MATLMKLAPEFERLLPYVEQASRLFAKLAESFAQDPIGGGAKLVAAKSALDIAMSGVGEAGKKLATGLSDVASKVTASIPGGDKMAGVAGSAGMAAQIGLAAATVILTAGIVNFERRDADVKQTGAELNLAREAAKGGNAEAIAKLRQTAEQRLADSKKDGMTETFLGGAINAATMANVPMLIARAAGVDFSKHSDTAARGITGATVDQSRDSAIKSQETMVAEMRALEIAAEKAANALAKVGNGGGASSLNTGNSPSPVVNHH
jgi:hypothetical protein